MGDESIPFPDFFPEDWEDDSEELSDERSRPSDEHASEGTPDEDAPREPPEAYPGQSLLRGTRPSEVLQRLSRGDPLNMARNAVSSSSASSANFGLCNSGRPA